MKIGLPTLLFLIFLTLKLTHQIAWSWVWVTAPLWAGVALVLLFSLVALLIALGSDVGKPR